MSIGKRTLPPVQIFTNQSLASNFDSSANPSPIHWLDTVGFIIQVPAGSTAVGSFAVYGGLKATPLSKANPNYIWSNLQLAIQPLSGSNLVLCIPIPGDTFLPHVYLAYTATSGSGVCNAWITGKAK